MFYKNIFLATTLAGLFFTGCSFTPPMPKVEDTFQADINKSEISDTWWESFNDPTLNNLVNKALKNSTNLELARLNIQRARQTLALENTNLMPTISGQAGATRAQSSGETASRAPQMIANNFSLSAVLNYEIDLWDRVKNATNIAEANFIATQYDYESARLSIVSHLATTYFSLLAYNLEKDILISTMKNYKDTMDYRKIQLDEGAISEVVYLQSKAEYEKAKIKLSAIENNIDLAQSALAMLSGESLDEVLYKSLHVKGVLPKAPLVPSGISSDILLRRADVASAFKKIEASNLVIGVAKSAYYPTLSLTGALGFQSNELDRFFISNASIWSLAGSLVGNIFDFGRTSSKIKIAQIDQNLSIANYENVVKTALIESRNALNFRKNATLTQKHLQSLIVSLKKINALSNEMYKEGYTTHLELLDSQRALLNVRLEYVESQLAVLNSIVAIYKAFGGGFVPIKEEG